MTLLEKAKRHSSLEAWILLLSLTGIGIYLLALRFIPFQDIPAHTHIFLLDQTLAEHTGNYLTRPDHLVFCYNLYIWMFRLGAPLISADTMIHIQTAISALSVPLSLMFLAASVPANSSRTTMCGLLALPICFSWPLKMGFIPFALGVPLVFISIGIAIRASAKDSPGYYLALALTIVTCYCAHALTYAIACLGVGLVWLVFTRGRWKIALKLVSTLLVSIPLVLWDFFHGAFEPVPGTHDIMRPSPLEFRDIDIAIEHLVTRSYGVGGLEELYFFIPLFVILCLGVVGFWRHRKQSTSSGVMVYFWLTVSALLLSTAVPESLNLLYFLASRLSIFFVGFLTVLASVFWSHRKPWIRQLLLLAVFAALGCQVVTTNKRATTVNEIMGESATEKLKGKFLTAHVASCNKGDRWGHYDSERHLWTHGLAPNRGITPYFFAWNGYHPIHFVGSGFSEALRAPYEHINSDDCYGDAGYCRANRMRILGATRWSGYDGVIITGRPDLLEESLASANIEVQRRLHPGIALVKSKILDRTRLKLIMGTFEAAEHLGDGWGLEEYAFDTWTRWAIGHTSTVNFDLDHRGRPYLLTFYAGPHEKTPSQTVDVELNGQRISSFKMSSEWTRYEVEVPSSRLKSKRNSLVFHHSKTTLDTGKSDRRLATCYSRIELKPGSGKKDQGISTPTRFRAAHEPLTPAPHCPRERPRLSPRRSGTPFWP